MDAIKLKSIIESEKNIVSLFEPFYLTLKVKGSNWVLTLVSNGLEFRNDETFQETIVLLPESQLMAVKNHWKNHSEIAKQKMQKEFEALPKDPDDLFAFLD